MEISVDRIVETVISVGRNRILETTASIESRDFGIEDPHVLTDLFSDIAGRD